jgi:hypothetical protein
MPLWRGFLKGTFVTVLISAAMFGLWYGSVFLLLGTPTQRILGVVMVAVSFRSFIFAFDLMWGRPAVWSKDPVVRAHANDPDTIRRTRSNGR